MPLATFQQRNVATPHPHAVGVFRCRMCYWASGVTALNEVYIAVLYVVTVVTSRIPVAAAAPAAAAACVTEYPAHH